MKKLFRIFLMSVLAALTLCAGAFAATVGGQCGNCGDGTVQWRLNTLSGELTISGNGVMADYAGMILQPWGEYRDAITSLTVEDGVTAIGARAFIGCANLRQVRLGKDLERIGRFAFCYCASLETVTLPAGVKTLEDSFGGAVHQGFAVEEGNTAYRAEDGVLFTADGEELVAFPVGREGTYTVPAGVKRIGPSAFEEAEISAVKLPGGLTEIGEYAFMNCNNLSAAELPEGVWAVGTNAFAGCDRLQNLYLPASLRSMGQGAFASTDLVEVRYGGSEAQWQAMDMDESTRAALEEALVFGGSLPEDSVTEMSGSCGESARWHLDRNEGILTVSGSGAVETGGWTAFPRDLYTLVVEEGITALEANAFSDCAFHRVTLPESIREIGKDAFSGCEMLEEVRYAGSPNGWEQVVIHAGNETLLEAKTAWEKEIEDYSAFFTWTEQADGTLAVTGWKESRQKDLLIPREIDGKTITAVAPGAFRNCTAFESIVLPESMQEIGENAFWGVAGRILLDWHGSLLVASGNDILLEEWRSHTDERLYDRISATVRDACLYEEEGTLWRVEHMENGVLLEELEGGDGSVRLMQMELPLWGGFFAGETYNYLLFGQENMEESDACEVLRLVQYSKDWQRLGAVSLYGANTQIPFLAGTVSFAEDGNTLYIHTCHTMYMTSDGLNHQSNLTVAVGQTEQGLLWAKDFVSNSSMGYVSHSFDQNILVDSEGRLVTLDLGDAYPRGAFLYRYWDRTGLNLTEWHSGADIYQVTGATVTGLEEVRDGYLSAWSDSRQNTESSAVYLAFTPKDDFTREATVIRRIWDDGSEPLLVPVDLTGGYILWRDGSGAVMCGRYDAQGSVSGIRTLEDAAWSECHPILWEGEAVWYATEKGEVTLYTTAEDTGATVRLTVPEGSTVTLGEASAGGGDVVLRPGRGTADLVVRKSGCLTYTVKDVKVEGADVDLGSIELLAGDVTGDEKINMQDLRVFLKNFNKTGDRIEDDLTDVTGDSKVNMQDLRIFLKNFNKTAAKDCTVSFSAFAAG